MMINQNPVSEEIQEEKMWFYEDRIEMKAAAYRGLRFDDSHFCFPSYVTEIPVSLITIKESRHSADFAPNHNFMPLDSGLRTMRKNGSWSVGNKRIKKMALAKKMLRDLNQDYERVFGRDFHFSQDEAPGRQGFFNSNLIHLIASTDGNEDTIGHSQLVSRYTLMLAKALGITDKYFLANAERGAALHDIGKIGIPDSILRKPGALTDAEKEVIKEHPQFGYEIIEEFDFLRKAARVVLFHHESYDGSGYPYGLAGHEIPLEARIFAVADTLDAVTSDRPYRKARGFKSAYEEIERGRGIQFDPEVADAFLSVPEQIWQRIKAETEASLQMTTVH